MPFPYSFDATRLRSPHTTAEHEAWRDTVRTFVKKEIIPFVNDWDEAGAFPRNLHQKAAAVGLNGIGYPTEYGGFGEDTDVFHSLIMSEEMARAQAA